MVRLHNPHYSSDLSPSDIFLLTLLKNNLYRRRYEPLSAPGSVIVQCLHGMPKKSTYQHSEPGLYDYKLNFCVGRTHQPIEIWISLIMRLAEPQCHN